MASVRSFAAEWLPIGSDREGYFSALCRYGWSAPGWPQPWGGGLAADEAFLVERTLGHCGAPLLDTATLQMVGPLLLALADDDLCRRFLPAMASGRMRWALHGSIRGAAPLPGRFLGHPGSPQVLAERTLAHAAADAESLALVLSEGTDIALVLAELSPGSVLTNQPSDPDTVYLGGLTFEVLASSNSHPSLATVLAGPTDVAAGGVSCWTARLRFRYEQLLSAEAEQALLEASELAALGVELEALEAVEQRAVVAADASLREALAIRSAELGRTLAGLSLQRLGYYALPAPEADRQHNELPAPALAARDAMAELIRYLDGDARLQRDRLAAHLGLPGDLRGQ